MNKLTIKQAQHRANIYADDINGKGWSDLYQQLADTMRENEQLRDNIRVATDTDNLNRLCYEELRGENKRFREALESLGGNRERIIDHLYDKDCPICSFNGKRIDDHINGALESNKDIVERHPDDHRAIGTSLDKDGNIKQALICIYRDCPIHSPKTSNKESVAKTEIKPLCNNLSCTYARNHVGQCSGHASKT